MRSGVVVVVVCLAGVSVVGSVVPAAAADATVSMVSPKEGSVVTGAVELAADAAKGTDSVTFTVTEGSAAPETYKGTKSTATRWTATWPSGAYSGAATIAATATDGGTTIGSDDVAVTADNAPPRAGVEVLFPAFSPNGDGRRDRTRVDVTRNERARLVVRLKDADKRTLRRWSWPMGKAPVSFVWGGRAGGGRLPDGRYRFHARLVDIVGLAGRASAPVIIDTRAPRSRVTGLSPEIVSDQDRVRFGVRTRDRSPEVGIRLHLFDALGRIGQRRLRGVPTGDRGVRWRPRYADGGLLFPGNYRARVVVTDDAGNRRRSRPFRWRVHRSTPGIVYSRLQGAGRRVALTFDDCHYPDAWAGILDTLKSEGVRAAFFCPGQQVRANPKLARRTVREGHVAASHAWDHADLAGKGYEYTASRLRDDAAAWWEVARATSAPYFRPPYGSYDDTVVSAAGDTSHPRVMMWDVDPRDWKRPGSSVIASRVVNDSRRGSVILLHTIDQTASALPSIIRGLRDRRLRPVSLPRLFRAAGLR
ncbi:MAG: polysaccharide deacetylase family protein [Actinomycetota bacterium]|nr:polysaccharide deacetylase family protein [Actinomycetota bacterium]